jgi:hypothetical protein
MSTSGSYTYSVNRDTLIAAAFRVLGVFNDDSPAPTTDLNNAVQALNLMIKQWMSRGYPLWCVSTVTVPCNVGNNTYTLGPSGTIITPRPLRCISGRLQYSSTSGLEVPLIQLSREEWEILGQKNSTGTVNSFYYDPQTINGVLHLYVTPDSTQIGNNVLLTVQRPIQDMINSGDDFDFPIEWLDALKYGLASEMVDEYDIPSPKSERIIQRAEKLRENMFDWSVEEASTFFTPNMQYLQTNSKR